MFFLLFVFFLNILVKIIIFFKKTCEFSSCIVFFFNLGVESAAITGDGKNQLEVVGEVDAATLTSLLRKNLGQADLVSVGPAGGDKKPAAPAPAPAAAAAAVVQSQPDSYYYVYPPYQYPVYQVTDSYGQSNCSIM